MYLRINPSATPGLANGFTVTKDWTGSAFVDGGGDAFDSAWGAFTVDGQAITIRQDVLNAADGVWSTNVRTAYQPAAVNAGWLAPGLLAIEWIWQGARTLGWSGNLGSDGATQSGTVSTTVTIGGQPVVLATTWSNDGGQDATGGDPQVTRTLVPLLASAASGQRYSVSVVGDQETGTSTALDGGCMLFLQWGAATVAQVQSAIAAALTLSTAPLPALIDPTARLTGVDIRMPPRAWAPAGMRLAGVALRHDAAYGGRMLLAGYTEIDGTPPERVGHRRLLIFDQLTARLVRETWSDATGFFQATDLADRQYLVVTPDDTLVYDPAGNSHVTPEPMP